MIVSPVSLRDVLLSPFVDLVLGGVCAGCERPGVAVCPDCRLVLGARPYEARPLEARPFAAWPEPVPAGLAPPMACAPYDGVVRAVLLAHKENGRYQLAGPLGEALASAVRASLGERRAAWLCPVPSPRARIRARGHDPLGRIAAAAARRLRHEGYDVRVAPVLRVVRRPADQAGLTATDRSANLAGAFRARSRWAERLTSQPILAVDDVITTGATLTEACRALTVAGIPPLGCAVVAATRRRFMRSSLPVSPEAD